MPVDPKAELVLYHAPKTRAFTALWLLEELELSYRLESFELSTGRHKRDDYLRDLNPMGKVPVVQDGDVVLPELGAIAVYLSDRVGSPSLAPIPGPSRERAEYLRWCFFASAIIEPAMAERFFKWDVPASSVAWGSFADMHRTLTAAVANPWLVGDVFTAADVLVASLSRFGLLFGAFPKDDAVSAYVERASARRAFRRAEAIEAERAAETGPV